MNHGVFQSEYQNREHKIMLVSEYEAFSIGKVTNTRVAAAHITARCAVASRSHQGRKNRFWGKIRQ